MIWPVITAGAVARTIRRRQFPAAPFAPASAAALAYGVQERRLRIFPHSIMPGATALPAISGASAWPSPRQTCGSAPWTSNSDRCGRSPTARTRRGPMLMSFASSLSCTFPSVAPHPFRVRWKLKTTKPSLIGTRRLHPTARTVTFLKFRSLKLLRC